MKHFVFALLMVGTVLLTPALNAQSQKIGYVISPKIFEELPEAQDAQNKLAALDKQLQDTIAVLSQEFQARVEEYQKKETMMNDAAKRAEQQQLQEMQRKASDLAEVKRRQLVDEQEKILNPIREKIRKAIEAIAKEEKYNFVFDKNDQIQVLIYGDVTHDLTFKVIDRLKRGR